MAVNDNASTDAFVQTEESVTARITLYVILLIWSLTGNLLVIITVCCSSTAKSTFNNLIVNISVSDLFIPLIALPIKIAEEATQSKWLIEGDLGKIICKLCFFLADTSPVISVFSLAIITVERFVLTVYPVWRYKFTTKMNWILISCTWIAASVLISPHFYTFNTNHSNGSVYCYPSWRPAYDESAQRYYVVIVSIVAFILPFISINLMYSFMLYKLHQNNRFVQKAIHCGQRRSSGGVQRNKTVFYISISICIAFGVLWGPYFCAVFIFHFSNLPKDKLNLMFYVMNYLAYANSAINPCIYFFFLKSFRDSLRKIFRRNNSSEILISSSKIPNRFQETAI